MLKENEHRFIQILKQHKDENLSVGRVAILTNYTKNGAAQMINRLIGKGYIKRERKVTIEIIKED